MTNLTNIEWTDATWNPVRGCSRVSVGCKNCYAEEVAARFDKPGLAYHGLTRDGRWNGKIKVVDSAIDWPLRKTKPLRIFANSMSDLFHENMPDETIAAVLGVMLRAKRHTFQVLTKRPERMRRAVRSLTPTDVLASMAFVSPATFKKPMGSDELRELSKEWPPRNVWFGVSVENGGTAESRIPVLLDTPAAVRFVSYEPALGPVEFGRYPGLDWVIVGGESGHGAREFIVGWARRTVAQCRAAGVACFVKQMGQHTLDRNDAGFDGEANGWPHDTRLEHGWERDPTRRFQGALIRVLLKDKKGGDMAEWPESLRVREFPKPGARA